MSKNHPPLPHDEAKTIEQAIQKIRFDKVENIYIFKNGKQIRRFKGDSNKVSIDENHLFELENSSIIHNHPSGSSFSIEDVKAITKFKAKELILVTHNHIYTLKRPPLGWNINFDNENIINNINTYYNLASDEMDKMISKNEISPLERDKEIFHYIWSLFFQQYEIDYKKTAL